MPKGQPRRNRLEEAADWALRVEGAALGAATAAALEDWLARDPENRRAYDAARRLMEEAGGAIASDPQLRDFDIRRPRAGSTVATLVALILGGALFVGFDGPMRLRADRVAGAGEMLVLTLEEGSVLQLNASSAVAIDFSEDGRIVRLLRGQAYFEVAPDPARPFSVQAGSVWITALGTAFDVRLGCAVTEVTVTEHAVRLEVGGEQGLAEQIVEGERAILDTATGTVETRPADVDTTLAWREGRLVLEGAPLSYVVEEMNRHFAGRIVIGSAALADRRVSGTLAISDTEATLAFLRQALGVTVNRFGPLVFIR